MATGTRQSDEQHRLISIVVPCYNYGRFLNDAIQSCQRQTYSPIEIVVVNDGSTDNTSEVIRGFASQPNIQIIESRSNRGTSWSFNTGVRASRGFAYAILDADDLLDPTFVERTAEVLTRNTSVGYVYTDIQMFGLRTDTLPAKPFNATALLDSNFVHVGALTRRSAFDATGGFDERLTRLGFEDWNFRLCCLERGIVGAYLPQALYCYRQHGQSRNTIPTLKMWQLTFTIWSLHPQLYPWPLRLRLLLKKMLRQIR